MRKKPVPQASAEQFLGVMTPAIRLSIVLDARDGAWTFQWTEDGDQQVVARGRLSASSFVVPNLVFKWEGRMQGKIHHDACGEVAASTRALLRRISERYPPSSSAPEISVILPLDVEEMRAGVAHAAPLSSGLDAWRSLESWIRQHARLTVGGVHAGQTPAKASAHAALPVACTMLHVALPVRDSPRPARALYSLRVVIEPKLERIGLSWFPKGGAVAVATGFVRYVDARTFAWDLQQSGHQETATSTHERHSVAQQLNAWLTRFPTPIDAVTACWRIQHSGSEQPLIEEEPPFSEELPAASWLLQTLLDMAAGLREVARARASHSGPLLPFDDVEAQTMRQRLLRKEQRRAEEAERRREQIARAREEYRRRAVTVQRIQAKPRTDPVPPASPPPPRSEPPPPVALTFHAPAGGWQETTTPNTTLAGYALRERAAQWWISSQSDDLLCLPHCRIERLDYQIRAALRALGALRGRALLSDEVGLGKTIEAGLVIKELLTRGMAKRFLVLTQPSLVDQWQEELADKFGISAVTTNEADARAEPERFWRENLAIVASLHTLKQPAQLAIARDVHWDLLVVDEAHHLRNRESQAWQAVNILPRQYLLLLTATPVQNSLEELYNLVTLLKPGQLPTPREFRARFIDPDRPRQPREPAELRRLLGQVMIRNTRASAGVKLPPRQAETIVFEPEEEEAIFWRGWEADLRAALACMPPGPASLWGRLLLQAAGSSPAAWTGALEKFPDTALARSWRERAPLASSWRRKCRLLEPLARSEGGVVVFTQFLDTQAALAAELRGAGTGVYIINGATPAAQRQPITEEFRRHGGALVLTRNGTEGRNLQFSHCLANFDLPWNPMEIEQRIGRLHRLGQKRPVRIHNFVQAGTLQEHVLALLQEKLNLFELVVGETGLVLGERFSGDELEEEILRRWREHDGRVAEAFAGLGDELAAARGRYDEVRQLDETLFAQDFESL